MANLITNPDFEVDTSGWSTGANLTIARDTTQFHGGVASLKSTVSVTGQSSIGFKGGSFGSLNLTPGVTHQITVWVRVPSAGYSSGTLRVYLWDFTANVELNHADVNLGTRDAWQQVSLFGVAVSSSNQGLRTAVGAANELTVLNDFYFIDDAVLVTAGGSQDQSYFVTLGI